MEENLLEVRLLPAPIADGDPTLLANENPCAAFLHENHKRVHIQ